MYGNHPYGTRHKRDIPRRKSIAPAWRLTDNEPHKVTRRRVAAA